MKTFFNHSSELRMAAQSMQSSTIAPELSSGKDSLHSLQPGTSAVKKPNDAGRRALLLEGVSREISTANVSDSAVLEELQAAVTYSPAEKCVDRLFQIQEELNSGCSYVGSAQVHAVLRWADTAEQALGFAAKEMLDAFGDLRQPFLESVRSMKEQLATCILKESPPVSIGALIEYDFYRTRKNDPRYEEILKSHPDPHQPMAQVCAEARVKAQKLQVTLQREITLPQDGRPTNLILYAARRMDQLMILMGSLEKAALAGR